MACILIIDDAPAGRTVMQEILAEAGYEVLEASDGREGLRVCHAHPVDLVLTEMLLPAPDGFEIIQAVRSLYPTVKLIAMTGRGIGRDPNILRMAEALGAHRIVQKPVQREDLLEAVQAVLAAG